MMKGSKSGAVCGVGKRKATEEGKGRCPNFVSRLGWTSIQKTSKLRNQENVNKYLARYSVCLNPEIKVEFCPHGIDVS